MPLLRTTLAAVALFLLIGPATLTLRGRGGRAQRARGFLTRARDLLRLVVGGHPGKAFRAIAYRLHSDSTSLGMRRDLAVPFTGPAAKIPFTVRPLAAGDDLSGLDPDQSGISSEEAFSRLAQQRLLHSGLETCYVAIAAEGTPCYMQWVIASANNDRVRATFGNLYPVLGRDEALLEGAFTLEAYRGFGIMGAAMAQVAERAANVGARWVITFVDESNQASVKGSRRAGFAPYLTRHEKFRFFRRFVTFQLVSQSDNVRETRGSAI